MINYTKSISASAFQSPQCKLRAFFCQRSGMHSANVRTAILAALKTTTRLATVYLRNICPDSIMADIKLSNGGGVMSFYAEPLLREARERVRSLPSQATTASAVSPNFDQLAEAVEKAIRAALVENHGSVPQQLNHGQLVSICQSTGVWDVLPPALKGLIQEVEWYRSKNLRPTSQSIDRDSSEQLQKYFIVARRLIDYMEFHVIGNDSVLKRLKVA